MTVIGTKISWTNSTWNLATGCDPVSAGCERCYAKQLVEVRWGWTFKDVRLHPDRLVHISKFKPIIDTADGRSLPHLVFVNSLSDFFYEQIPDDFIHAAIDKMEGAPNVVFQILSKRPIRARKIITERFGNCGVPKNIWFGFSAEDNRVAGRINILRKIKDRVGDMVAFLSVEPIVGPTDLLDFEGIDWVITGGESGHGCRVMERGWLMPAVEKAIERNIPLWHKQSGSPASHPNMAQAPHKLTPGAAFNWLIANGWEMLPEEKGGATIDKKIYRRLPAAYHQIATRMNQRLV